MPFLLKKSYIKYSKNQFPDVVYEYVSNTSMMPLQVDFTRNEEDAYVFEESELEYAEMLAESCDMRLEECS